MKDILSDQTETAMVIGEMIMKKRERSGRRRLITGADRSCYLMQEIPMSDKSAPRFVHNGSLNARKLALN